LRLRRVAHEVETVRHHVGLIRFAIASGLSEKNKGKREKQAKQSDKLNRASILWLNER